MTNLLQRSFTLVFCSIVMLSAQSLPDWVEKMPKNDEYYYARENVGVRNLSEEEFKDKANAQALKTISMQIRTTVSGQSQSGFKEITTEKGGVFIDEFESESSTFTIADIQGAEMVDDHTTSTTYWVLWRLNKSLHEKNMKQYVNSATSQYEGFTYVSRNDPVQQLQYLVPAFEDIIKVAGVDATFKGKNLRTEIPNQISAILNSLRLMADGETEFTVQVGYNLAKPLKVRVKAAKEMTISDIPILYTYESGEGTFSKPMVLTSASGRASTKVTKIISRKTEQRIRAKIDLKEWREDRLSKLISFEKRLDKITEANSVLFTLDVAQVTQEKIAVITVGDTTVFSEKDLKRLNRSFRSEFSDITDFKLKDEALIEGIIDSYKRSANLCSNEECQIQIGKKLGVEKLIFIDVSGYAKQTDVTIFLRNIADNELEEEQLYPFSHDKDMSKSEKIQMIFDNINAIVNDFWIRNNPAFLTIYSNRRNVKADFEFLSPTQWMEQTFEKRLPLNNQRFFEGDYQIQVNISGYEPYKTGIELAMGESVEYDIDLIQKTPGKAFLKSFLIPGRGQIYSADKNSASRKVLGYIFMGAWVSTSAAMGATWSSFITAQNEYTEANDNYLTQKLLDDVQAYRTIAKDKNDIMIQKQTTAIIVSSLWGAIWLGSALEAMINFPKARKRVSENSNGFKLAMRPIDGKITPQLHYYYHW